MTMMSQLMRKKFILPFLKGVWIYTLILWVYIVADMFVFPQYQYDAISRFIPIPQNLIGVIAFPLSFLAFIAWEYIRNLPEVTGDSKRESGRVGNLRKANEITQ